MHGNVTKKIPALSPLSRYEVVDSGILFSFVNSDHLISASPEERNLIAYLLQLEEEEYLVSLTEKMLLTWDNVYRLMSDQEHEISLRLLGLPALKVLSPILQSQGSLSDIDFTVYIVGWFDEDNNETISTLSRKGPNFNYGEEKFLMPQPCWDLIKEIKEFERLKHERPGELTNQLAWSQVRKLGAIANARFDSFLERAIVLRPESLRLKLHRSSDTDLNVLAVEPFFEGQPEGWIDAFDRLQSVPDRYSISSQNGGVTHVLITAEVRTVLQEIRKLPGRRVAGDNALQLLRNPYACLGDDAEKVLNEAQFQRDKEDADFYFFRFQLHPVLSSENKIIEVNLQLEPVSSLALAPAIEVFENSTDLHAFVSELRKKLGIGLPCGFWKGYQLELSDFTNEQLSGLEELLDRWKREQHGDFFDQLLDLSSYGSRVIGIGAAASITSPYIQTESKQKWIPEELVSASTSEIEMFSNTEMRDPAHLEEIRQNIEIARAENLDSVTIPGTNRIVPFEVAMAIEKKWSSSAKNKGKPKTNGESTKPKSVLLIENNIELAGFVAQRVEKLSLPDGATPRLPRVLKADVRLREHQLFGVAQLQHIFDFSPSEASGYLLADDMGLGKTIQLLTFIFSHLECSPNCNPVLIVAPVSLLDNWENEMRRFFDVNMSDVLKLYGSSLNAIRLPKNQLPSYVKEIGITNLLVPDWLKDRKIVLTTYETLRDQEFSLARQNWSIVVCDEAQKIKNPSALVTQAAKALPARFKIACTGTPVENSLTDLWCLFDFIQPGFLGALNEFGKKFCKVESESEEIYQRKLDSLRELIKPQLLRRMKRDIAKDLPPKHESQECKSLSMGKKQETLYRNELSAFSNQANSGGSRSEGNTAILGLLHKMKMICAHPSSVDMSIDAANESPKLLWVLAELQKIKLKDEKVILFTELREIQRALQLAILDKFSLQVTVINGDTNSSSEKGDSRQKLIDRFQERSGFGVIILSTTAVGFGVNVQKANHVIHFTRCWNPAKEDQATDRAYRIGQEKPVYVYYPTVTTTSFETFEQKLDNLLNQKRALADDMLRGTGDIDIQQLAST
jgi:hypothetical protein